MGLSALGRLLNSARKRSGKNISKIRAQIWWVYGRQLEVPDLSESFGDPFFGVNMWPTPVTYWGCRKNETLNFWCAKLVDLSPTQPTVVSSHQWTQQSAYAQCGCWHEQSTQWTVSSQHDGTKQLGHVIQLGHAILRYWYHLKKKQCKNIELWPHASNRM